jgi:hypothetical protein
MSFKLYLPLRVALEWTQETSGDMTLMKQIIEYLSDIETQSSY